MKLKKNVDFKTCPLEATPPEAFPNDKLYDIP